MAGDHAYKEIQLPQLRSFCLAASERSFTTAAKALGLSVSAVWQQVRALERLLGTTLLRRRGWAVELTEDGQLLLELVQPHLSGIDSLAHLFAMRRGDRPGRLVVASTYAFIAHHLPEVVRDFVAAQPAIHCRLRADIQAAELAKLIAQGEADLGLFPHDRDEPRSPYLTYENLSEVRLYLLAARDHPLARKRKPGLDDIVAYPLVMESPGSLSRRLLERLIRQQDIVRPVQVVTESITTEIISRYVALGIGVSLLYLDRRMARALETLHVRELGFSDPVPVAVAYRKGAHLARGVEVFLDILRKRLHG